MDRGLELEGLSTITRADIEVARGGARSRLSEGLTLSNRDLLHAALMGSDNRAIPALGRAVRLSPSQLAADMTAKARSLGLKHTRFHDPTGLSVENVSTPRETILLLQAVMRHPILGPITRRVEYQAHPVGRPAITYVNTYRPAIRGNVEVLGGKTGYNDDARYCLVLAAKVEGKTCFMSFLSNEGKMTRFGDVARVADWMVARRPKALAGSATSTSPGLASAGPIGLDASGSFGPELSAGALQPAPADPSASVPAGSEPTMVELPRVELPRVELPRVELPRAPYESVPPTEPGAPTAPISP
jgi:D-alanyl-D-alanine endopeptidase (penicillin-binding protein 7)